MEGVLFSCVLSSGLSVVANARFRLLLLLLIGYAKTRSIEAML